MGDAGRAAALSPCCAGPRSASSMVRGRAGGTGRPLQPGRDDRHRCTRAARRRHGRPRLRRRAAIGATPSWRRCSTRCCRIRSARRGARRGSSSPRTGAGRARAGPPRPGRPPPRGVLHDGPRRGLMTVHAGLRRSVARRPARRSAPCSTRWPTRAGSSTLAAARGAGAARRGDRRACASRCSTSTRRSGSTRPRATAEVVDYLRFHCGAPCRRRRPPRASR